MIRFLLPRLSLLSLFLGVTLSLTAQSVPTIQIDIPGPMLAGGRFFCVFQNHPTAEPFWGLQSADHLQPTVLGQDAPVSTEDRVYLDPKDWYGFPELPRSEWVRGASFVSIHFHPLLAANDEGIALYSGLIPVEELQKSDTIKIELENWSFQRNTSISKGHYNYELLIGKILSDFWQIPMSTQCQVILPKSYFSDPDRVFPTLYVIHGFGGRFFESVLDEAMLFDPNTPEMIVVVLDSKAPFGDSYQMNSANNGPYADALIEELIPHLESEYRMVAHPSGRFLTGTSTGGWSSLALQIFYPDFFNGVWSTCADPVDFRQMELINIYEEENAFVNRFGLERPAMRSINGEPRYTVRMEVRSENVSGHNHSYVTGGGQWGSWNAVYSPRDTITGLPRALFDPETGVIDPEVAEHWKKYDLRLYLAEHWAEVGPSLQGKLHLWMGTMDSYYLNNAMELMDRFLRSTREPASDAEIHFICGEGHACDQTIPLEKMMRQMVERWEKTRPRSN